MTENLKNHGNFDLDFELYANHYERSRGKSLKSPRYA